MKNTQLLIHKAAEFILILFLLAIPGCSFMSSSLDQAQEFSREKQYDDAVEELNDIISSDATETEKAQAFMLRGKAYTSLKEYRYAYRDLQVAWKLSCHIYQHFPEPAENSSETFDTANACIEQIPILIDNLKPFTSDFGAIMATQNASAIVKKLFPSIPR